MTSSLTSDQLDVEHTLALVCVTCGGYGIETDARAPAPALALLGWANDGRATVCGPRCAAALTTTAPAPTEAA